MEASTVVCVPLRPPHPCQPEIPETYETTACKQRTRCICLPLWHANCLRLAIFGGPLIQRPTRKHPKHLFCSLYVIREHPLNFTEHVHVKRQCPLQGRGPATASSGTKVDSDLKNCAFVPHCW